MTPTPLSDDHPVERQLKAYNAHDLDGFIKCFDESIRLVRRDGTVAAVGHEALREAYRATFAIPGRHATILNRIVVGHRVVDHEEVTDSSGSRQEAVVTYALVEGQIVEMRILA